MKGQQEEEVCNRRNTWLMTMQAFIWRRGPPGGVSVGIPACCWLMSRGSFRVDGGGMETFLFKPEIGQNNHTVRRSVSKSVQVSNEHCGQPLSGALMLAEI